VTLQRIRQSARNQYKRAHSSIKRFYIVGSSETTREYLSKYKIFKGKDIVRALTRVSEKRMPALIGGFGNIAIK